MDKPIISWYIKEQDDYVQNLEYYLGSFSSDSEIILDIQVWNNRYGSKDVETIENARLTIYFDTVEDSSLLKYCSVSVNSNNYTTPEIEVDRIIVPIGILNGSFNDGLEESFNESNFKNISIKFSNFPKKLKNGLKNMFLDIEFD